MSCGNEKMPRKRRFISLERKIQILDRLENGERVSRVAKTFNYNEATIRTIQKNEQKIRASAAANCSISANMTSRSRAPIIEKMEKALTIWIDDCSKKRIKLDTNIIKHKALKIYDYLKENGECGSNPDFVASKGWFHRFRKRFSLQSLKMQGESALALQEAAETYRQELQEFIERGRYSPHQVFNADETSHWWKKMPKRTFISKNEKVTPDFDASKHRVTLLLCSNASGEHMVKPMLVHNSLNSCTMTNLNKTNLPVYLTENEKALVTTDLFKTWFFNCFVPSVEKYLEEKNLDFKVLLILRDAPSHPKYLNHPNVQIIFFPPRTTPLLQPLDQGIITTFKTNYITKSLEWVLNKVDEESMEAMEAWERFTITDCINLINSSINDIKSATLSSCWRNIWPGSVESENLNDTIEYRIETIIGLAKCLGGEGFDDMTIEDIQELLVEEETDEANLIEMTTEIPQHNSGDDSTDENEKVKDFNLKSLQKGLDLGKHLELYFQNEDPCTERSAKFKRELDKCLATYNDLYRDLLVKSKQSTATNCLREVEHRTPDNVRESSEDENVLPKNKQPRLIVLSSDDETDII